MNLSTPLVRRLGGIAPCCWPVALVLIGPLRVFIGGTHGAALDEKMRHAILDAMIYQMTLGGVLVLFEAPMFLTKKPGGATKA